MLYSLLFCFLISDQALMHFAHSYLVFRGANKQKHLFKKNPKALIWGKPPKVVGGKLLISGYWYATCISWNLCMFFFSVYFPNRSSLDSRHIWFFKPWMSPSLMGVLTTLVNVKNNNPPLCCVQGHCKALQLPWGSTSGTFIQLALWSQVSDTTLKKYNYLNPIKHE
jgi:hypothetical protein